jgi:hypothetical protein
MFTQIDRRLIINRSQSASLRLTLGARAAERLREVLGGESAEPDSPRDEP